MVLWAKINDPECIVSSEGRIFAFRRDALNTVKNKIKFSGKMKELKQFKSTTGYLKVNVHMRDGKRKGESVHKLVALAFLVERPEGLQIDHIDRNPLNNNIKNLRYVTPSENTYNRQIVEDAHKRLGDYKDKNEYERKRLRSKGIFRTRRNGKDVYLTESERIVPYKQRRKHEVSCESGV